MRRSSRRSRCDTGGDKGPEGREAGGAGKQEIRVKEGGDVLRCSFVRGLNLVTG